MRLSRIPNESESATRILSLSVACLHSRKTSSVAVLSLMVDVFGVCACDVVVALDVRSASRPASISCRHVESLLLMEIAELGGAVVSKNVSSFDIHFLLTLPVPICFEQWL